MTTEELGNHVEKIAKELAEHFDAVQILASHTEAQGTLCIKRGCGNWYARQGMAQEFIQAQNAEVNAEFIGTKLEGNSD
jgi:hypothetical protein